MATGFMAGAVVGKLMLDKTKWSQSINDVKKDEGKMTGMAGKMGAGFTKMGAAMTVAGAAIVAGIGKMISSYVNLGDEIDKMSRRTGFAASTLSELAYAADISGASLQDVEKGIKKMSKTIVDAAEGMTTYERAFARIGLASADLKDLNIEDQFFTIAEAIAKIEDPTLKAATAQDIFGRAGTKLLPLFAEGETGMAALREEAHKLGIVFDEEAALKAAKLKDAQTALKGAVTGLGLTLAEKLVPALTSFALKVTDVVAKVTAWGKAHPGLFSALMKIAGVLGIVLTALGPMVIILPKIVAGLGMLKTALIAATGPVGLLVAALGALTIGYMKVKAAQQAYLKSAERAGEAEDNLFNKLKKAADQAGLTGQEFLKLRDAYKGNAAAMAMAINRGKEGEELQAALRDVSKEHKEEVDKQKDAYEAILPAMGDYGKVVEELVEKSQTWTDFMKDLGMKTIPEQEKRIENLEAILRDLEKAYDDGAISLEDYTAAVAAAKTEMVDLIPPTAIENARDMTGVLDEVAKGMDSVSFATKTSEQVMYDFASATGQSIWEVKQKIYDLAQSIMALSGIHMPDLVISNKAAWSQIAEEPPKVKSAFDKVADGLKTKWATELSAAFQKTKSWKDAVNGIWGSVKSQFFDMVGSILSKWTFDLIGGILTGSGGILDALTSPFKGFASALTGSDDAAGGGGILGNLLGGEGAGGFLGAIAKIAGPIGIGLLAAKFLDLEAIGEAVSGVLCTAFEAIGGVIKGVGKVAESILGAGANIISGIGSLVGGLTSAVGLFGSLFGAAGKKYGEITYWLDLIWQNTKETRDILFIDFRQVLLQVGVQKHLSAINQSTQKVEEIMEGRFTAKFQTTVDRLKIIWDRLGAIKSIAKKINEGIGDLGLEFGSAIGDGLGMLEGILESIDGGVWEIAKNIGSAQAGAVLTEPQLIMTHGTPAVPEIIAPVPALGGIIEATGGGKIVNVNIRNEVNLLGTIITDREFTRERMIPEIIEAIDSNADHIKRRLKKHLGI